jgi:hypothetical protein
MLQLYFKRAKIFLHNVDGMALRYNAVVSSTGAAPVPDWVKHTLTYKWGIKDKSIIDLTPPSAAPLSAEEQAAEITASAVANGSGGKDASEMLDDDADDKPQDDEPADKKAKKTAAKNGIKQ